MNTNRFNKLTIILILAIAALFISGCYWNEEVNASEIGVKIYGGSIDKVVPPGIYSEATCYFCDLKRVSLGTLTFTVEDPEVLTSDNQPVGEKVTIQARRSGKSDDVINLLTNWPALVDDQAMIQTISATAREALKNGTRVFTLTQLLDDRNGLAQKITEQLELDSKNYSVDIVNVTIENIAPSDEFIALLQQKANYTAQTDAELQRQKLIIQQRANERLEQEQRIAVEEQRLLAEKAKTAVEVEIAQRDGELIAARNQVYSDNPQAMELERLSRLQNVFGDKTVYMFLQPGTDITMLLSQIGTGNVIPLQEQGPPAP